VKRVEVVILLPRLKIKIHYILAGLFFGGEERREVETLRQRS
jgi:hypothetical protein